MSALAQIKAQIESALIFIESNRQNKPDPTLGEIRTLEQYIMNIARASDSIDLEITQTIKSEIVDACLDQTKIDWIRGGGLFKINY